MALNFPTSPTNGQVFDNYYYDSSISSWRSNGSKNGLSTRMATEEARSTALEVQVASIQLERPTRVNLSSATTMDVSMTGFDEYELSYNLLLTQASSLYLRVRLGGVMVTASNYYGNQAYGGSSGANSTPGEGITSWRPSPADADRFRHNGTLRFFSLNAVEPTSVIGHSRSGNLTGFSLSAVFGGSYEASQAQDGVSLYPVLGTMTGYYTLKKVKYS